MPFHRPPPPDSLPLVRRCVCGRKGSPTPSWNGAPQPTRALIDPSADKIECQSLAPVVASDARSRGAISNQATAPMIATATYLRESL